MGGNTHTRAYPKVDIEEFGVWRSLVAHLVWDQRVQGSNPCTPTIFDLRIVSETFLLIITLLLVKPINSFSGFAASKVDIYG